MNFNKNIPKLDEPKKINVGRIIDAILIIAFIGTIIYVQMNGYYCKCEKQIDSVVRGFGYSYENGFLKPLIGSVECSENESLCKVNIKGGIK